MMTTTESFAKIKWSISYFDDMIWFFISTLDIQFTADCESNIIDLENEQFLLELSLYSGKMTWISDQSSFVIFS